MDYEEYICADCKYFGVSMDAKHCTPVEYCGNENGRGTNDGLRKACKYFEKEEEE